MTDESIDWAYIWSLHAPHFNGGQSRIPLGEGKSLLLDPGAGFGDLSHQTTKLIFTLMRPFVEGAIVVDIGSGSGILTLAAALLGANKVYAFEIDPDAIQHTKHNIALNQLESRCFVNTFPNEPHTLVLMNMISSEQREVFKGFHFLSRRPHRLLTSGILTEEREEYLSSLSGYKLISEVSEGEWSAFEFVTA